MTVAQALETSGVSSDRNMGGEAANRPSSTASLHAGSDFDGASARTPDRFPEKPAGEYSWGRPSNESGRIPRFQDSPQGPNGERRETSEEVLQEWEGVVESVEKETFTASMRDLTAGEAYPGEVAELPVEDVSDDDMELLETGAVFYLTVGRSVRPNGQQERFGRMAFRRLPLFTSSDFSRAEERARRLARFLGSGR